MADYLFVYGTLRRDAGHPMHRVLSGHSEYAGPARCAGRLYDLGRYPALVADPGRPAAVAGELYRLLRPELLLPVLDRYEGCTDSGDTRAEYRRELQPVLCDDGSTVRAWIYVYNRPSQALPLIASGDYLRR